MYITYNQAAVQPFAVHRNDYPTLLSPEKAEIIAANQLGQAVIGYYIYVENSDFLQV